MANINDAVGDHGPDFGSYKGLQDRMFAFLSRMESLLIRVCDEARKGLQKYELVVVNDPDTTAKLESAVRLISFVLPARFKSSELLSELIYFASKMLCILHDFLYRKHHKFFIDDLNSSKTKLEIILSVLEYIEAFIELGAFKLWGETGKWVVVLSLQIFKALLRVILLFRFSSGIQTSPSFLILDRNTLVSKHSKLNVNEPNCQENASGTDIERLMEDIWNQAKGPQGPTSSAKEANEENCSSGTSSQSLVWKGKRSGRIVRSLTGAKRAHVQGFQHDWKVPTINQDKNEVKDKDRLEEYFKSPTKLSSVETAAELAFILRPVAHLLSMFYYGEKSWKPWLLSAAIDISSLNILKRKKQFKKSEKEDLAKRHAMIFLYLLRSPFYDKYAKAKLIAFLMFLQNWLPGAHLISEPLLAYLPGWQKMYSHCWST